MLFIPALCSLLLHSLPSSSQLPCKLFSMEEFSRIQRLPPYVFNITGEMKVSARRRGEDIIDFGMGNPDGATPRHIVDKMIEAAQKPVDPSLLGVTSGLPRLRRAICNWYQTPYGVQLDPDSEAIVTIGSKEGIAHLCLAILDSRDTVLVPNPSYPIHIYGPVIAGAHVVSVPDRWIAEQFLAQLEEPDPAHDPATQGSDRQLSLNPTTQTRRAALLRPPCRVGPRIRIHLIHDLAYADIAFDGYKPPSSSRCPEQKTSPSSSSPCRRATTCPAGASDSWSAIQCWSTPWRA